MKLKIVESVKKQKPDRRTSKTLAKRGGVIECDAQPGAAVSEVDVPQSDFARETAFVGHHPRGRTCCDAVKPSHDVSSRQGCQTIGFVAQPAQDFG